VVARVTRPHCAHNEAEVCNTLQLQLHGSLWYYCR